MRWKYILCSVDGKDVPIIFPSCFTHRHVFNAMGNALRRSQLDDGLREWPGLEPLAAGFLSDVAVADAYGVSESLDLKTDGDTRERINAAIKFS